QVGGDAVTVVGLVKPDVDPHEYEPKPDDLKQLGSARLVLASGKNIEHYLPKLQAGVSASAVIVKVGDQIPSLKMTEENVGVIEDPHWWHNVANVEKATKVVRDALIQVDPEAKATFEKNAGAYLAKLAALDTWVKKKVAELPRDRRELVTSHDAFQYFAKQYGFRIYAIEGVSTEQEASAKQVDDLIAVIKKEGVKAIFLENTLNPKVSTEVTRETGAKIGGTLYADGLGAGEGSTYEGMVKHNVSTIVEALK
ncbi:MAG TPA: metal ABC transporter substrate-binding protein, partial [Chthoniobacterales bacterium]|nr:metal ABC transporter substrate-binding protein [Chthoniobacterales bacterium]